ncbi:hypothetical protein EVAR_5849_1 [Eumeta japonica]|uniref:SEA domain-containing protein n=1 Tax=Eumeta variegata TaxID=151549 RepID=A0A4C1TCZ2_EUMVA|nr:hypothetical protein EVAR_5849_1 [Eumeta japonica]
MRRRKQIQTEPTLNRQIVSCHGEHSQTKHRLAAPRRCLPSALVLGATSSSAGAQNKSRLNITDTDIQEIYIQNNPHQHQPMMAYIAWRTGKTAEIRSNTPMTSSEPSPPAPAALALGMEENEKEVQAFSKFRDSDVKPPASARSGLGGAVDERRHRRGGQIRQRETCYLEDRESGSIECCARGRPIIVEWERDARHSAGLSLVRNYEIIVRNVPDNKLISRCKHCALCSAVIGYRLRPGRAPLGRSGTCLRSVQALFRLLDELSAHGTIANVRGTVYRQNFRCSYEDERMRSCHAEMVGIQKIRTVLMNNCWKRNTITKSNKLLEETIDDESDFYYTPVERSFAQVQPPLFPNSRPTTYIESTSGFGIRQPELVNAPRQHAIGDGRKGFPAPNYNQHPAPFQLATGKSQSNSHFFVNQPDFTSSQRQRFRPSFPHNYQLVHPASTRRPDVSQIHSVAYQNDPSKPETFLGQVTLNNPDIDYLQNNRFKNTPFNGNSLKNVNHHSHGFPIDVEDDDDDDQDLFEHHKVTTYNPLKLSNKQRLSNRPSFIPIRQNEQTSVHNNTSYSYVENNTDLRNNPSRITFNDDNMKLPLFTESPKSLSNLYNKKLPQSESTDYKTFHDIEPLLEDDISDLNSFKELMKNNQDSLDVQVIKHGEEDLNRYTEKYDSNPSASSMDMSHTSKEVPQSNTTISKLNIAMRPNVPVNVTEENKNSHYSLGVNSTDNESDEESAEQPDEAEDDIEYYDESENDENEETTKKLSTTNHPDIYDEYDSTEVNEQSNEELKTNITKSFDVLMLKPNSTIMKDDNFKDFVNTRIIDHEEDTTHKEPIQDRVEATTTEEVNTVETPAILGQEVVSVVTTKSVVNGTISVPDVNYISSTINPSTSSDISSTALKSDKSGNDNISTENPIINATENWIVVASVQTSRSVSGARFLPFPTVEQEEKKQVLTEADEIDNDATITESSKHEHENNDNKTSISENINDKLDSIQSELSSAVLEGGLEDDNKNITLITESTEKATTTTTTTTTSLNIFTLKSTQTSLTTEKSSPEPLPVLIKKFTPRITTTTTPKPKRKPSLVTVMDDLTGLLPPGYKPRTSYKDKRLSTTTTSTTTTTTTKRTLMGSNDDERINGTQPRSSGISSKNKVIILDDKTLLPRDYKPKETSKQRDGLFENIKEDDISKFLPPDFKLTTTEKSTKENESRVVLDKVKKVNISSLLPKDYKEGSSTTEKILDVSKLFANSEPVDISAFLPPSFKANEPKNDANDTVISKFKVVDVSSLLPPGFNLNQSVDNKESISTSPPSNGFKVVFPSRPGSKNTRKITTPKSNSNFGPSPVTPKIQKGWPTRASTEFTGWPTPSTTPFSIEKLLEAQRNATATTRPPELSTEATTRRMTTTTTTTPIPPPPTTPGVCRHECDLAATIKIVSGVKWVPELLDHHTQEWQNLAKDVKEELNSVYSKSDYLKKWYKGVRIDAFSKGSVLVDYFIELNEVEERIDTLDLKKLFHKSLTQAKPGSVVETVTENSNVEFDPDVMLGDQPEEDRMMKSNEKMSKVVDKSAGKLEMGKFIMDPAYTEFIVLPKREEPTAMKPDEESLLPQWGIAVIVIALASLLFVIIFGVTVRMSTAFIEQLAYPNPGDSWRSGGPQLQKYMQHYAGLGKGLADIRHGRQPIRLLCVPSRILGTILISHAARR